MLYVTPERFRKSDFLEVIAQRSVRLLVVDEGRLVGIVTLKDLLAFLALKVDLEGS